MNKDRSLSEKDKEYLEVCLELAQEALEAGDKPFGSILVSGNGEIIRKARNRIRSLHPLSHPEYELAHWAAANMSVEDRKNAILYTTGEHCPMCSGAQAWAGIGTIVYLSSGRQLASWIEEFGLTESPIQFIPAEEVIKDVIIRGPAEGELLARIKEMQRQAGEMESN